jgi:HEAT repeat protein
MKHIISASLLVASFGFVWAGGGLPRKEDMPKYIKAVSDPKATAKAKTEAVDMIGKRGAISAQDVEGAIEPLKMLMQKDKDAGVRKAAVTALGNIAPQASEMVPLFIQVLRNDASQDVKFASVTALGRYGPDAKAALPAIREFAKGIDKKKQQPIRTATMAINGTKK